METNEDRQRAEFKNMCFGFEGINRRILNEIMDYAPANIKQIYESILTIVPLIKKLELNVDIVPLLKSENGIYWSDYAYEYLDDNFFDKDYMYFTIYLNNDGCVNVNHDILISYSSLTKEKKCSLLSLFYQYLPSNFDWDGDNNRVMTIKYDLIDNPIKLDFDLLSSDDTYPLLQVFIAFEITNDYDLFDYIDKDNIITEIEGIFNNNKITCSYGNCDIEIRATRVNITELTQIYHTLTSILSKVKRKQKENFGVRKCKFYYYDTRDENKVKTCAINCDPQVKDRFFDFDKYL